MRGRLFRTLRANRGLMLLLATVLCMGGVQFSVIHERVFLNLYFLPVLLGAYRLDRRNGVYFALLSILVAGAAMLTNPRSPLEAANEWWMRPLDFATWGGTLVLAAHLVGSLSEQRPLRLAEIRRADAAVLEVMHKLIDAVDRDTESHCSRVADHSIGLARTMRLSKEDLECVRIGAWLHDIGRLESSMEALRKAAGPTLQEIDEVDRHDDDGGASANPHGASGSTLSRVIAIVTRHHERWDGTGARHLKGDEIPIGARIVAVANTFDTIVTDGPYRGSKSHAEAIETIQRESGQAFDPQVVEALLRYRTAPTERLAMVPRLRGTGEILPAHSMNGSEKHATRPI